MTETKRIKYLQNLPNKKKEELANGILKKHFEKQIEELNKRLKENPDDGISKTRLQIFQKKLDGLSARKLGQEWDSSKMKWGTE